MKTQVHIFFDGSCDNNSKMKLMGAGVYTFLEGENLPKYSKAYFKGTQGTSNIAEWEALTEALKMAVLVKRELEDDIEFHIFGDSQIIVKQFNEEYEIHKPYFKPYFIECKRYAQYLGDSLQGVGWIRRQFNTDADKLSKAGVTEFFENLK